MTSRPLPDYLKTPHGSTPSFHFRVGEKPRVPAAAKPEQPANEFGYPRPGVQSPSPFSATAPHYFVDEPTWQAILDHGDFDDVVVGSGHCGLAYVEEALKRDPFRKILVLERGGTHHHHLLCIRRSPPNRLLASRTFPKSTVAFQDGSRWSIGDLSLDTLREDSSDCRAWLSAWKLPVLWRSQHLLVRLVPDPYRRPHARLPRRDA